MSLMEIDPTPRDDSLKQCALCGKQLSAPAYYVACGGESKWAENTRSGKPLTEFSEKDQVVVWRLILCREHLGASLKAISRKKLEDANEYLSFLKSWFLFGVVLSALCGFPLYYLHTHIVFGTVAAFARRLLPFPLVLGAIMVGSAVIFLPLAVLILYRAKVHEKRMNSCLEIEIVPENVTSCGVLEAAKQILSRSLKEAGQIDLFVPRFPLPEPRQIPERALKYPRRTYVRLRFEQKVLAVSKTQAEAIPAAWKTCTIKGQ